MISGGYVRVESAQPDADGRPCGMFGLLRDLRHSGRLSPVDVDRAGALVARSYELHDEPPAEAYADGAISWFLADAPVAEAAGLQALCADVAELLGRYGIETRTVRTEDPGRITYADDVQVVAVPRASA